MFSLPVKITLAVRRATCAKLWCDWRIRQLIRVHRMSIGAYICRQYVKNTAIATKNFADIAKLKQKETPYSQSRRQNMLSNQRKLVRRNSL